MVDARRAADRADRADAGGPGDARARAGHLRADAHARRHQVALLRREHARLAARPRAGRRRRAAGHPARPRARVPDGVVLPRPRRRGLDARRSPTTCSTRSRAASCSPSPTVREEPIRSAALADAEEAFVASSVHEVAPRAPRRRARLRRAGPRARASSRRSSASGSRPSCADARSPRCVGNRPQFVKAAAVCGPLRERHEEVLIHTGQHHDERALGGVLRRARAARARPRPRRRGRLQRLAARAHAGRARAAARRDRARTRVLLYGDTNSTLAGALAAADRGDARVSTSRPGMRSFDRSPARGAQPRAHRPALGAAAVLDARPRSRSSRPSRCPGARSSSAT